MNGEAGVLVIHCSDPRYQIAFHEFLHDELRLERYALLAVPGGPQFLNAMHFLPKFSWAGWRWVKFIDKLGSMERVVLIAHEECRWYEELGVQAGPAVREQQTKDLREICAALRERFPSARVEGYFASLAGDRAAFRPL